MDINLATLGCTEKEAASVVVDDDKDNEDMRRRWPFTFDYR